MKWVFTAEDARAIADKLEAVHNRGRNAHEGVEFYYEGRLIFSFGICRGSKDQRIKVTISFRAICTSLRKSAGCLENATFPACNILRCLKRED
jgi:hypothetical protein